MKKIFLLLSLIFSLSIGTVFFVSCTRNNTVNIDESWKNQIKFEDQSFDYDGNEHSIYVEGLPEAATVTYSGNNKVNPGEYNVFANVTYNDNKLSLSAKMTINKMKSILTAEDNQIFYVVNNDVRPLYTLNNNEQLVSISVKKDGKIVSENELYKVGKYEVELFAEKTLFYEESATIKINVDVKNSKFDVSYNSQTFEYDGTDKQLLLSGELPEGYSVTYENNVAKDYGKYYSKAFIKDSLGNTVETHNAVLTIDYADNEEFEKYLDDFFVLYLEGDQLSVNIFCEKPSDFGLEHYEAKWYTYTTPEDYNLELAETKAYFEALLSELESYSTTDLSRRQKIAYNQIYNFLKYQIDYYSIENVTYMELQYVNQFGGYVADFGTYMEAYSLRNEQDVQDMISYVNSTNEAFQSYLLYVEEKTKIGYGLSNYTIEAMTNYLDEILASHNPLEGQYYYLQETLCEKIDNATDILSESKIEEYKSQLVKAFDESFIVGTKSLRDGLVEFTDSVTSQEEGYWANHINGSKLFELKLDDLLGLNDFDIDSYIFEITSELKSTSEQTSKALYQLIKKYNINTNDDLNKLLASNTIFNGTPEEMLEYLKEFSKTIVPTLENTPNITIKEMDEASAKVSNAVAYYMKSALDNSSSEYITLNPIKLGDQNDVLSTMAHEGYPGHLYAYIYSKQLNIHNISKVMSSTAHAEGWATYVQIKLYEYAIQNASSQELKDVLEYLYYNHMSSFLLESIIDVGIHYQGWTIEKLRSFLMINGYNSNAAQDIYNLIIETPVSYAAYGYGKLYFYNLHEEAKEILGVRYDEIEFNAMLLSKGWTSLGELKNTYDEYIQDKCFTYGIDLK